MTPPSGRPSADPRRPLRRLVPVLLALLLAVVVAPGTVLGEVAYAAGCVLGAALAWAARVPSQRKAAVPWIALTLTATAAAAVGAGLLRATGWDAEVTPADALAVAAYVPLSAMLLRGQVGGVRRAGTTLHAALDAGAALAVTLLVVFQTDLPGALAADGHGRVAQVAWTGYVAWDAVLVGLVAWRVVLHGRVRRAALLGLLGSTCWLVSDIGRLVAETVGGADAVPHGGRLAGVLLLAVSAWTRSAPADRAASMRRPGHGPWRIALNIAPFAVPAVLEVVGRVRGAAVDPVPDVVVWGVLLVLSSVRTRLLAVDGERAWEAVRSQGRRYQALALNASDAVAVVDHLGRLQSDSASMSQLLGRPAPAGEELPGLLAALGVVPVAVHTVLDRTHRRPGVPVELELEGRTEDGAARWLGGRAVDLSADPDVAGTVVTISDITRRKLAEQELAHQAFHDPLTGLANRSLFLDRAEQALRRAGRTGGAPIVLCLDLDGFKDVNDSMGHLAGDALLGVVAQRLRGVVRPTDTVARLGGDEFAVLVDDPAGGLAAATELAERLLAVLREPVDLDGAQVVVGASTGIVTAGPSCTPLSLLQDGDIAMYQAKSAGRGRWVAFDPGMRDAALQRIELERQLATALDEGQLRLVYQPVVALDDDRVVGFEALLRWQHPVLGAVGPDRFVPLAESSGLIVPIGRWVLAEATRTVASWQREHPGTPLSVAVNVSPRQLAGASFPDDVAAALADSGIAPSSLTLEITETALVTEPRAVAERLAQLNRLGVRIALDDFGTGYSSLSYLREFPVDVLKIDRSFVRLLSGQDAAIVHGIIQLGRTLDLEVVAEGVEDEVQLERLRRERCHLAQGYLFSRPLEARDAARSLRRPVPSPAG